MPFPRKLLLDGEAVALCPFASRVPVQLMIVPRRPVADYGEDGTLGARLLQIFRSALEELHVS